MKKFLNFFLVISLFVFSGCLSQESSTDLLSKIGASTCKSAEVYSYDGVLVTFSVPDQALEFKITRDGNPVLETLDKSKINQIDPNLTPGQTYRYRCEVVIDRNIGYQKVGEELVVTLPVITPPTFAGLKTATLSGTEEALLEWDLTEDAILSHYKVFKYIGTATDRSDFPEEPIAVLNDLFAVSSLVSDLGDEITYSFRVAACNASDICDDNNAIRTVTTPDTGAPTTSGATGVSLTNGIVTLNTPWSDQNGHVSTRSVYRASTATGTACPAIFGLYGKVNDVIVVDPKDTPQQVDAAGVLNEGLKYCFVVRDTDPSGNIETNFNIQSVEIGDITNPDFLSPVNLVRDVGDPEGTIVASWTAMLREVDDPLLGAHEYLVYLSSVAHPGIPDVDPCATGSLYQTVPSVTYAQGSTVSLNITGLNPRNWHRVCVKAKDSSSNEAVQSPKALASTGDVTSPTFAGIQAATFNSATASIDFSFVVPVDTDVRNYRITTVRTRSGVVNSPIVLIKTLGALSPNATESASFTLAEADLGDNDVVSIRVDVCDDANPDFNNQDNCSATSAEQVLTLPDATPPPGFTGISTASRGVGHRAIEVSWGMPSTGNWNDYAGFKIYYVNGSGDLVGLNSSACLCAGGDCVANPKLSCEVSQEDGGALLVPSKTYEMYVAAFDLAGNQTVSYIAHSGGSKITAFSKAQDIVDPNFNANMVLTYDTGAKIVFDAASDEQDSAIELTYEIYRKENSTFTCAMMPYASAGGCDNLSPLASLSEDTFAVENAKLVYVDNTVTDGVTYYYQFCAVDDAGNRKCQDGAVGELIITDITAPVVTNVDSDKTVGGGTSWTISFDVSDNIVDAANLIVNIYKSTVAYPTEADPGIPAYTKSSGTVSLSGNTASFTDTGVADIESAYYLILVQDLSGNKTYMQARDMTPAPVITNVIWPDPIKISGHPMHNYYLQLLPVNHIRIIGTNLLSITDINGAASAATGTDKRHCEPSRITTHTDTEIVCGFDSRIYPASVYTLHITDKHNRTLTHVSGSPSTYCEYAALNGITDLRGAGTYQDPYVLCSPDHVKLIGRDADNPNNSQDYIGFFSMVGDIDFTGVTDFKGIPVMQAGEFYIHNTTDFYIKNLTIDTSATNEDAAFVLGCEGSTLEIRAFFNNIQFDNVVVRTGAGRAAVGILDKNCDLPIGTNFVSSSGIINSEIHADNTAGFWAAEYKATQDNFTNAPVRFSKIYSTRPDNSTAVGGVFGKLKGNASAVDPEFNISVSEVEFWPRVGETDAGYNIGGLVGEVDAPNVLIHNWSVRQTDIYGGLEQIGGAIGHIRGKGDDLTLREGLIDYLLIDNTGSLLNHRGGVVGDLVYIHNVEGVSNLTFDDVHISNSNIHGEDYLGGFVSDLERSQNISGINGCYIQDLTITGNNYIGGFTGRSSQGSLSLSEFSVGFNEEVVLNGNDYIGGINGNHSQTTSTFSKVGIQRLTINTTTGRYLGGFFGALGKASVTVSESAVGDVNISGNSYIGGLAGTYSRGSINISDFYVNDGTTLTGVSNIGGLFGRFSSDQTATINLSNTAVFGKVIANSGTSVGAFFGSYAVNLAATTITLSDNYYANHWTDPNAVSTNPTYETVGELEGKSLADFGNQATYLNWDFVDTWQMTGNGQRAKLQVFAGYGGL